MKPEDVKDTLLSDVLEAILRVRAVSELASANFPRDNNNVRIETCGSNPTASLAIPAYLLRIILDAAVAAFDGERNADSAKTGIDATRKSDYGQP